MAAKGEYDPTSLRSQIDRWLTDHPGMHRPVDIAEALGLADQPGGLRRVAIAARGLWETGRADRIGQSRQAVYGLARKRRVGAR